MTIVTKDFSPSEIYVIATKIGSGHLTSADQQQLISEYKSRLSPEDLAKLIEIVAQQEITNLFKSIMRKLQHPG